ncbi:glutamine amidotransferase [Wenzhouxiangella marina]|uniref:Glutamine amidotransferase n=1 Tax=Wenzhouxiangella marina TaxID=1579979 RepID=A0A0K0XRQ7_9GAMM|nr:glutamine amidotransferase [Wenzhouxiangella marina]AKS40399.1 Glutamine amidotransferase [Wenzhouxiangella marina]MBB6088279.1 GMP synthase (glutamine-hydrolyzing) [Wenzhouxiangella marina]
MIRLLILKTGSAPAPIAREHGDFEDWFVAGLGIAGSEVEVVNAEAGQPLPERLDPGVGVLVTGSPAMVSHRLDWSERAAAWLRKIHAEQRPLLGVCYGHQLIAHALGGRVGPNPAGRRMGSKRVRFLDSEDVLTGAFVPEQFMQVTHLEVVLSPPPGAEIIGDSPGDPHHVLRFGPRAWGVQFHPEFSPAIMASYLRLRADALDQEEQDARALEAALVETPAGPRLLQGFAELLDPAARAPTRNETTENRIPCP